MQIQGYFDLRFETVRDAFAALFDDAQERGAALCVKVGGETVLDLWAGVMDKDGQQAWHSDTIANLFSCTKPFAAVVVEREGFVPFRTVLAGAGPWRVEVPEVAIELEVVGADAQPLTATVVLADVEASVRDGRCVLRGLQPGRHRLYVSAPGHRSAIVDVDAVAAGASERAPLRIVLPAR